MKVNLFRNFFMTALAVMALGLGACSEDNPIDPDPTLDLKAPKNLQATAINDTTIRIRWDASDDETSVDFKEYVVSYKEQTETTFTTLMTTSAITNSTGTIDIGGLTGGEIYDIKVVTKASDNTLGTQSATVKWSPSRRFVINTNIGDPIRIYETQSTFGSGLNLFTMDGSIVDSTAYTANIGQADMWNLALHTGPNDDQVKFGSAKAVGYPAVTANPSVIDALINPSPKDAASLDEVFDSQAMNLAAYSSASVDLSTSAYDDYDGAVFYVKRGSNYAKVLVKKTGGTWLQGTAPNRYIEVVIAYQATENVPYARTSK